MTPRPESAADNVTGVPGLRTWRRVYAFVVFCFIVWVSALAALMRVYS